jgi:hypothetical protein
VIAALVIALASGLGQPPVSSERHARAADVRCDYVQRIECTASGCQAADVAGRHLRLPPLAVMVDTTARAASAAALPAIQVCDARGCTPIAVRAVRGGAFVNIAQDGGAHFVKVAAADVPPGIRKGDFVEVAARFLTTATFVGSCPALVP